MSCFRIRFIWFMFISFMLAACLAVPVCHGQETGTRSLAAVPTMVSFSGVVADLAGKPATGIVGVSFFLYREQQGGAPLWMETQNVRPDQAGRYSVMLGSTTNRGLPADLFASGEARWLGVQVAGQAEQPRVLLLSVPYALKAADAETLGGLPLSAFVLAAPNGPVPGALANPATDSGAAPSVVPPAASNVTTSGGTANSIPMFTTTKNIQSSILTQTGATAVNVIGKLNLPAIAPATSTAGRNSRPEDFVASAFNSTSSVPVAQTFQLQAEPTGNNTAVPTGTLSLLYGSGTAAPTETGFKISHKGILSFATGQTFPGTGKGTITGVVAGTDLTGGGTTGTVTLNLDTTKVLTGITAGTDLTGGGTGGVVTLKLDTTKVPQLQSNNSFTGTQKFLGNTGIGIAPSATGYTPLSLGGTTAFGTWFAISNSSAGGHTWNLISAGSGNAEGAGNLGITDLTGKSTIWLEGNTNTTNLTASSSAGGAIIDADVQGKNVGAVTPGLRFGGASSGEGIASNRVGGINAFGLQLFTEFAPRLSILQDGRVGIGATHPTAQLEVDSASNGFAGIFVQGGEAANGSGQNGSDGIDAFGNSGDLADNKSAGGVGGVFTGGGGGGVDGDGIVAFGGHIPLFGPLGHYAGDFEGDIFVNGAIWQPSSSARIDHPLDPANKFLSHSAVESPDMLNIYNGNVTTDAGGIAIVELPDWFEALNRDFRYQLTVIGQFAQAIVAGKIADHRFTIRTDKPNVEVSWQVTGIRHDAWANAHRSPVETDKSAGERGFYLHPELYGAPEEAGISWERHPQIMKQQEDHRLKSQPAAKRAVAARRAQ